jgi:hypothetical protein
MGSIPRDGNQDSLRDTAEYQVPTQATFRRRPDDLSHDSRQRAKAILDAEDRTIELIEELRNNHAISRTHAAALIFNVLAKVLKKNTSPDSVFVVTQAPIRVYDNPFEAINAQLQLQDPWRDRGNA